MLDRRQWLALLCTGAPAAVLAGRAQAQAVLAVARAGDAEMAIEFDARLYSRVIGTLSRPGLARPGLARNELALTEFAPTEWVGLAGGGRIEQFFFVDQAERPVRDIHGAGIRRVIRGRSREGLEKTVELTFYERYPGFALQTVRYQNAGAGPLEIAGWTSSAHTLNATGAGFWSFSGSSHADRRDWVQPVRTGFKQVNFMGMNASDYGSGTPIADVWRPDFGLAVGHVETRPKLVSLPIIAMPSGAAIAIQQDRAVTLKPGDGFSTLETFVCVHRRDYFATLDAFRRVMADKGLAAPVAPAGSYEGIWCAWGYDRVFTLSEVEGTLGKAADLGLKWAVLDDGWQSNDGDWGISRRKFPRGEADMIGLVQAARGAGLKARLWVSPLAVEPGADLLHDHPDMLLRDKDGAPQLVTWWNALYLCPAYAPTIDYTKALVRRILGEWGYDGLKIDGQHLNGVAPCYNPAHNHAYPEESVEKLQDFWKAVYETAREVKPEAVVEICPCGDCYAFWNFPYMNQAPASDPESSWQVRLKGKSLKALMGPSAPFSGDHVELSDHGDDWASTVGVGAVVSTKFTWPGEGRGPDGAHFKLTPEKEAVWRKWIALYDKMLLPTGTYRGELYDIGFDKPEAHVVEKGGKLYYAFYADRWSGPIELRGLGPGRWRLTDYFNDRSLGVVSAAEPRVNAAFERFLLVEAEPAGARRA